MLFNGVLFSFGCLYSLLDLMFVVDLVGLILYWGWLLVVALAVVIV